VGHPESFHGTSSKDVFGVNFLSVTSGDAPVPDALWVHDHHRALRTEVEAACLIHPDPFSGRAAFFTELFQSLREFTRPPGGTAATRVAAIALVFTHENMGFENGHGSLQFNRQRRGWMRLRSERQRKLEVTAGTVQSFDTLFSLPPAVRSKERERNGWAHSR
jgi:hypothetical protein